MPVTACAASAGASTGAAAGGALAGGRGERGGAGFAAPRAGFLHNFMALVNATFPHPDHALHNRAMGGSTGGASMDALAASRYDVSSSPR